MKLFQLFKLHSMNEREKMPANFVPIISFEFFQPFFLSSPTAKSRPKQDNKKFSKKKIEKQTEKVWKKNGKWEIFFVSLQQCRHCQNEPGRRGLNTDDSIQFFYSLGDPTGSRHRLSYTKYISKKIIQFIWPDMILYSSTPWTEHGGTEHLSFICLYYDACAFIIFERKFL